MKLLATAFLVLATTTLSAQTLFYYGEDSVSAKDFLKAYKKNNSTASTNKSIRDYLDLYIASRLKIREAKELGLDTLPQLVSDLDNLRQQILPNYLNDKESVNNLTNEAFQRSQKDIHLAHIFISTGQGTAEQMKEAEKKLAELKAALQKPGASFSALAKKFSDDPSARNNGGDIGWITVFDLPYELENLAYTTAAGKTSPVHQSKAGYHIFKNLGERKDPGRVKAAQILLAFPPDADEQTKFRTKKLADSLYERLQKGDDFAKLAPQFSNDVVSAAANGQMQEFGVGQYEPDFENTVFALSHDGDMTRPFMTTHGYHIVKRLGRTAINTNSKDVKAMQNLRDRVEQSDRMATTRAAMAQKILKQTNFQKTTFNESDLYAYSDSVMAYKPAHRPLSVSASSKLFHLGTKDVTVSDWISYAQTFRYKSDGSGIKPYPQLWNEFVEAMALDYYQNHLEDYNEDFRQQITEFREGNLFFEIMQEHVWGPAQTDSAALVSFYNNNKAKYNWNQSADAVIFYASDIPSATQFETELKKNPSNWKHLVSEYSEKIAADSSRFELAQIPNPTKLVLNAGTLTTPLVNKVDNTASFAYILHHYNPGGSRSFTEARGLVINDYQAQLEKSWLAALEKKYPVKINEKVLASLVKAEAGKK